MTARKVGQRDSISAGMMQRTTEPRIGYRINDNQLSTAKKLSGSPGCEIFAATAGKFEQIAGNSH
jgi:hypothetical protein